MHGDSRLVGAAARPGLSYGKRRGAERVGDGGAVLRHGIARRNRFLQDGPGDLVSALVVGGQVRKRAGPGAGGARDVEGAIGDVGHALARCAGRDGQARRTHAGGVFVIVPDLGDVHARRLDDVHEAGHHEVAIGVVAGLDLVGLVTGHLDLRNAPHDLIAVDVARQVCELVGPDVGIGCLLRRGRHGNSVNRVGHAIGKQGYGQALGSHAELVVVVDPQLLARQRDRLGAVGIGDRERRISVSINALDGSARRVLGNLVLGNRVDDGLAIALDRIGSRVRSLGRTGRAAERGRPAVIGIEHNLIARVLAVCEQVHGDAFRPDSRLVVLVVPYLRSRNGQGRCLARVRHLEVRNLICGVALRNVRGRLDHVVGVRPTLLICCGHVGERVGPGDFVVGRAGERDFVDLRIVVVVRVAPQFERERIGTQAVAVAIVYPCLGDGDITLLGHERVGNRRA